MSLPLQPPFPPMEALLVDSIPEGAGWHYEPKWDGFRCLAFRDDGSVYLQSKSGQPLARYFPELVSAFRELSADRFILDGEIAIPVEGRFSFDDLLLRIHPAASRIERLANERPALYVAFDLLASKGRGHTGQPLLERRRLLEDFARRYFRDNDRIRLSPATQDFGMARKWLRHAGGDLDGIIAKRLDLPYKSAERTGMKKVKLNRTADCVVGGFRYASAGKIVGSLLLGLCDEAGLLNHVGFCSGLSTAERRELTPKLERLIEQPGFTGRTPGGPSRWSTKRSMEWEPLRPELVVEVSYDHFTGGRFRHGTKLIRWRPDKSPRQCLIGQVAEQSAVPLSLLAQAA